MSDDLVTWLRAQLDEDERVARAAYDLKHRGEWVWRKDSRTTVRADDGLPIEPAAPGVERGPHIARWHPARVLAEVDAKRRIITECDDILTSSSHFMSVESCDEVEAILAEHVVRALALPYAGQPGWREEWRPT